MILKIDPETEIEDYDEDKLSSSQIQLRNDILDLSTQETAFQIAKTEYEKKERRFIELTHFNEEKLRIIYYEKNLVLKDVDLREMQLSLESKDIDRIITEVQRNKKVINKDIQICYDRVSILKNHWMIVSNELINKINNFEQRGIKLISNNLRLKLLPSLKELKSSLKSELVEGAVSRVDIDVQLNEMVQQAKDDVFGDLTDAQIDLLNDLGDSLDARELGRIVKDESMRNDLIELLDTGKITLSLRKIVDRLI
jgi:hypothetical protein